MSNNKSGLRSDENVFDEEQNTRQKYGERYYDNPVYCNATTDIGLRCTPNGPETDRKRCTSLNNSRIPIIVAIVLVTCALIAGIAVAVYFTSISTPQNKSEVLTEVEATPQNKSEVLTEVEVPRVKTFQGTVSLAKNWDVGLSDSNSSLHKEHVNTFTAANSFTIAFEEEEEQLEKMLLKFKDTFYTQNLPCICSWETICLPKNYGEKNSSSECGTTIFDDSRLSKILFGRDAILGQLPWQIALYADGEFICGGSIIHPNWILTAAHCTISFKSYSVIVGAVEVGDTCLNSYQGQLYSSSRTHNNPLYNSNFDNDNSLLYLNQPIAFNNNVRPICIASSRTFDEMLNAGYNTECYVSGWGNLHGYVNRETWKGSLQMVRVYLYNKEECNQIYYDVYQSYPQSATVCVDNQNLGSPTCFGDSGGPLICRNKYGRFELLGTLSWGYESCFKDGYPDIYQLTYPHADWIEWTTGLHLLDLTMDKD